MIDGREAAIPGQRRGDRAGRRQV